MKNAILITAAAALLASPAAYAQESSSNAPGHEMQQKGSVKGTSGASGYAPGHATSGSSTTKSHGHDSKTKNKY
jgi:hypothetical protein